MLHDRDRQREHVVALTLGSSYLVKAAAVRAYNKARSTFDARDWADALTAIQALKAFGNIHDWTVPCADALLHLGRYQEAVLACGQDALLRDVIMIIISFLEDGYDASLHSFMEMMRHVASMPLDRGAYSFSSISFLDTFPDDALPPHVAIFASSRCRSSEYRPDLCRFSIPRLYAWQVATVWRSITDAQPTRFNYPEFDNLIAVKDGDHLEHQNVKDKHVYIDSDVSCTIHSVRTRTNTFMHDTGNVFLTLNGLEKLEFIDFYRHKDHNIKAIELYVNGNIAHRERVFFWVAEIELDEGRKTKPSLQVCQLRDGVPKEGRYYKKRQNAKYKGMTFLEKVVSSIVPACLQCDIMLEREMISLLDCPYCHERLVVYHRGARMFLVELAWKEDVSQERLKISFHLMVKDNGKVMKALLTSAWDMFPGFCTDLAWILFSKDGTCAIGPFDCSVTMKDYLVRWTPLEPAGAGPAREGLPTRVLSPAFEIPPELVRKEVPLEKRLAAGNEETRQRRAEREKRDEARKEKKHNRAHVGTQLHDFWMQHAVHVERVSVGKRSVEILVDGMFLSMTRPGVSPAIIVSSGNGREISRIQDARLVNLILVYIQDQLPRDADVTIPVAERRRYVQELEFDDSRKPQLHKRNKVNACAACDAMDLGGHPYATGAITCTFCNQPWSPVVRTPRIQRLRLLARTMDHARSYPERNRIIPRYHGRDVVIRLSKKQQQRLIFHVQQQFPSGRLGPVKATMSYTLRQYQPGTFHGAQFTSLQPGTQVHRITWRPPWPLPEDRAHDL